VLITVSGVGMYGSGAGGMREGDDSVTGFGENWLYGVAKAGAYGLTRHLANRGKVANIKVNAIAPIAYTVAARHATTAGPRTPPAGSRGSARSAPRSGRRRSPPTSCTRTATFTGEVWRASGAASRASSSRRPPGFTDLDLHA